MTCIREYSARNSLLSGKRNHSMDEYVQWSVGNFWQRILGSGKQASFIKMAGEPLRRTFTTNSTAHGRLPFQVFAKLRVLHQNSHGVFFPQGVAFQISTAIAGTIQMMLNFTGSGKAKKKSQSCSNVFIDLPSPSLLVCFVQECSMYPLYSPPSKPNA